MTKKAVLALAVSALACGLWASGASAAKHHAKHHKQAAAAPSTAETIPGVNPMTNAPAAQPVTKPAPYTRVPGVNPM